MTLPAPIIKVGVAIGFLAWLAILGVFVGTPLPKPSLHAQLHGQSEQEDQSIAIEKNIERLNDLERRFDSIDSEKLDERMTRMEAISESNHSLLITIAGGILLLLVERTLLIVWKRNERHPTG